VSQPAEAASGEPTQPVVTETGAPAEGGAPAAADDPASDEDEEMFSTETPAFESVLDGPDVHRPKGKRNWRLLLVFAIILVVVAAAAVVIAWQQGITLGAPGEWIEIHPGFAGFLSNPA
jgi:hypothetical protein